MDAPIIRGKVFATVVPELTPGSEHDLTLTIDVPDDLVAYGFRLSFSTPGLRERWHEGDGEWARLLLASECRPQSRDALLSMLDQRIEDAFRATADTLPDLITALLPPDERTEGAARLPTVHLIGHAHLDVEWLWNWEQAKRAAKAVCARAAELLAANPELRFSLSQSAVYDMLRQEEPALLALIRDLVDAGRWEPVTTTWVELDMNVPNTESIVRQLTAGQRFSERVLGTRPRVCVSADTFGHPVGLPALLTGAGCTAYFHTRCHPLPEHGGPAYRWTGPDGSEVIGVVTDAYDGELLASRIAEAAVQARRSGLETGLLFFDIDGHSGEEVQEALRRLAGWTVDQGLPPVRYSTLQEFVGTLAHQELPSFSGRPPTIFEATYTTQVVAKQVIHQAETALQEVEALTCMAGVDRRDALAEAWRCLQFWQNHDTAAGTAVRSVYERLAADFEAWQRAVGEIRDGVTRQLTGSTDADVTVVNPAPWARHEWVVIDDAQTGGGRGADVVASPAGRRHPVQRSEDGIGFLAQLAPWSVTEYRLEDGGMTEVEAQPMPLEWSEQGSTEVFVGEENRKEYFAVRNQYFSLLMRGDSGSLVSLVMRDGNRELVSYGTKRRTTFSNTARPELGLNVLQIIRERPHAMSAWHLHEVFSEESLIHTGRTSWLEQGPLRVVLRTEHTVGATTIVQDMTVYRDLPRIDVRLAVDWQEPSGNDHGVASLKVACAPDLPRATVHAAAAAGVVDHPANGQEFPMQRWVDVSDGSHGIAIIAGDRHGYDALGPRVRVSLVRGSYDPVRDADVGRHVFGYSLLPHAGTWREAELPLLAEQLARRPVVRRPSVAAEHDTVPGTHRRLPTLDTTGPGLLTAVKWADSGDGLICRIVDWSGSGGPTSLAGVPEGAECWRVMLTEEPVERLQVDGGRLQLELGPWAVETVLLRSPTFAPDSRPGRA
ncbi:glycoside hydrolase family 38 C-terminal domain-containing protein [Streptomyces sp. NPDC050164]|uniref:glycoside hydrolase family 38 N-terminal domain-containing protein n=1 Tax=Streptomyces sp. NPDC050164 TaxID=3365605 RepID=UPI0037A4E354